MVQRKYIAKYPTLKRIYPLFFWRKCSNCENEFRREWGWAAMINISSRSSTRRYLCKKCASSFDQANKYFLENKWKKKKPELFMRKECNCKSTKNTI